ncbi:MAG: hypothetical protein GY832_41085 [Chloroflexi bacterium]|nr:hypothetical protein [Chloroflexota bacterium]
MADKKTDNDYADASFEAELEEVWALYAEDGREALDTVEEALLTLESDPDDAEQIVRLFRALHTFKGNSRMMGLDVIEMLAHHAEDLVALVRDRGVVLTGDMINLLLEILDRSRVLLDHVMALRRDVEVAQVEDLMAKMQDMLAEHPRQAALSAQETLPEDVKDVAPVAADDASASDLEEDDFFPSIILEPTSVKELVDPATDPEYVRIFLEMAKGEMKRLRAALAMLAQGGQEERAGLKDVRAFVDSLGRATRRMGYEHLVAIVEELEIAVKAWDGDAQITEFERLELALSQELAIIQDAALLASPLTGSGQDSGLAQPLEPEKSVSPPSRGSRRDRLVEQLQRTVSAAVPTEQPSADEDAYGDIFDVESSQRMPQSPSSPPAWWGFGDAADNFPGASRLFKSWCKARMQADLVHLGQVVDELERVTRQFLVGGSVLAWDQDLVDTVSYLLRAIYYGCVFHRLDHGARIVLALEDLYARVAGGGVALSDTLLDLTRTCATRLNIAIESICTGKTPDTTTLVDLLGQIEEILHLYADSRVRQVTKDVLDLLDISPEFKDVMTSENLLEVSRALQEGKSFYTVLADLNQHEDVGQVFYEWSRSSGVRLITNITVFQDSHTLFRFLLATTESREAILETFAQVDSQGEYVSLEKCSLRKGVNLQDMVDAPPVQPAFRPENRAMETQGAVSEDALAGFLASVGEMVATRSTLHRVTQRLTEANLSETVARLVKQADGDWLHVRKELQTSLDLWMTDLDVLSRAENELGVALDQFQDVALALRARPASEILDPLQRLVQDVARHLGKMVELNVIGADVGLDHSALDVLADPVRRLVWFVVAHSIETPVERRDVGKPATGRVSVTVTKTADHAQVVIEDDGNGLDPAATLKRARELGWTKSGKIPAGKLVEWVLRDGFGMVGNSYDAEGLDLASINAALQVHRGRLDVSSEPRQGVRFLLDVPLDMVVIDGMVMRVGDIHYVVPIEAVRRIVKPEQTQIVHSSADGDRDMLLRLEEELIPIQALGQDSGWLGTQGENISPDILLLVLERNGHDLALIVDELIGQQQVLIQPLQGHLADVQNVSGCALLGEGDVGMVLDLYQMGS